MKIANIFPGMALLLCLLTPALGFSQTNEPAGDKTNLEPLPWTDGSSKTEWVKTHPDEYAKMNAKGSATEPTTVILPGVEGFPVYHDNGNPEADLAKYKAEKEKWIMAHPTQYNQILDDQKKLNDPAVNEKYEKLRNETINK